MRLCILDPVRWIYCLHLLLPEEREGMKGKRGRNGGKTYSSALRLYSPFLKKKKKGWESDRHVSQTARQSGTDPELASVFTLSDNSRKNVISLPPNTSGATKCKECQKRNETGLLNVFIWVVLKLEAAFQSSISWAKVEKSIRGPAHGEQAEAVRRSNKCPQLEEENEKKEALISSDLLWMRG